MHHSIHRSFYVCKGDNCPNFNEELKNIRTEFSNAHSACVNSVNAHILTLSDAVFINTPDKEFSVVENCGPMATYRVAEQSGIAGEVMLLLLDFRLIPKLRASDALAAQSGDEQRLAEEMRRAKENASKDGGPSL